MAIAAPVGFPAFSAHTRLLVVAPHPDDETIATGLLVQQVHEAGGEVRIVLLTAGDNNPWPQRWLERRLRIDFPARRRWAQRRSIEMDRALERLGLPPASLRSLGWPDLGVSALLLGSSDDAVMAMAQEFTQFDPNLIVFPSLLDRHPDHGAAHVLVRLALERQVGSPALFTYLVHGKPGSRGSITIQPTAAQMAAKCKALLAHHSQMALSGRRMRRLADRPERYAEVCLSPPKVDVLPWQPPTWLRPWLELGVVNPKGACRWAWAAAPLERLPDRRFRVYSSACGLTVPCFAHLSLSLRSPWIFEHWGWCELRLSDAVADAAVASPHRAS